ncbi:MAG: ChaN family lipoprotein [Candidatus Cloacimonetes bacterium]|nr:ChaN family lipoprotein [Candidatus Cloacimonadota bacterium]
MKHLISFILLLGISSLLLCFTESDYRIYHTKTKKYIKLNQLVKEAQKADVLFFGELHDDALMHHVEFELLKAFHQKNKKLAVSMEMFERDTQNIVDEYFQNKIEEAEFLQRSRAWPNYMTDYKAIVEYSKLNKIPLIAANVPRYIASMVNKKGIAILDSLSVEEKKWVAKKIHIEDGLYKNKFYQLMNSGMSMTGSHPMISESMLYKLFSAQCVKDDTMAESISVYLEKNPGFKIIHYNGDFHSQYRLGTVERLDKKYKAVVISPLIKEKGKALSINPNDDTSIADYILIQYRHQNK